MGNWSNKKMVKEKEIMKKSFDNSKGRESLDNKNSRDSISDTSKESKDDS